MQGYVLCGGFEVEVLFSKLKWYILTLRVDCCIDFTDNKEAETTTNANMSDGERYKAINVSR